MKSEGLQRQEALLTALDNTPIHCPSCRKTHTVKEIAGEDYQLGNSSSGKCPITKENLKRNFSLFGGEQSFTINVDYIVRQDCTCGAEFPNQCTCV